MSGWNETIRSQWAKSKEYLMDEARDRMHLSRMGIRGMSEKEVEEAALEMAKNDLEL